MHHHYAFLRNNAKYYLMERNRWLVLGKNLSARSLLLMAPLLASQAGVVAASLQHGWGKEKARAAGAFLKPSTWRYLLDERRRSQTLRRRSAREVTAHFRGDVVFEG